MHWPPKISAVYLSHLVANNSMYFLRNRKPRKYTTTIFGQWLRLYLKYDNISNDCSTDTVYMCTSSHDVLAVCEPGCDARDCRVTCNHRLTSCDVAVVCTIFSRYHLHGFITMLYHGRSTSYDIVRYRTTIVRL